MTFQESGFSFEFPLSWIVLKFDEHRFYKYLSGDGFKAVDFLCLTPTGELHFLEIKNYLNTYLKDGIHPSDALKANPSIYSEIYWKKYLDSIYLIELIHKFYQRKWWFSWAIKFGVQNWTSFQNSNWVLWNKYYQIIQDKSSNKFLDLWLEIEGDTEKQTEEILMIIKNDVKKFSEGALTEINIYHSSSPGYLVARPFHS